MSSTGLLKTLDLRQISRFFQFRGGLSGGKRGGSRLWICRDLIPHPLQPFLRPIPPGAKLKTLVDKCPDPGIAIASAKGLRIGATNLRWMCSSIALPVCALLPGRWVKREIAGGSVKTRA